MVVMVKSFTREIKGAVKYIDCMMHILQYEQMLHALLVFF